MRSFLDGIVNDPAFTLDQLQQAAAAYGAVTPVRGVSLTLDAGAGRFSVLSVPVSTDPSTASRMKSRFMVPHSYLPAHRRNGR